MLNLTDSINSINLTNSIYNLSIELCNDHGTVSIINNTFFTCDCDIAFFGITCKESGLLNNWQNGWKAFQGIFATIYGIMFCMVMKTFITNIKQVNPIRYYVV